MPTIKTIDPNHIGNKVYEVLSNHRVPDMLQPELKRDITALIKDILMSMPLEKKPPINHRFEPTEPNTISEATLRNGIKLLERQDQIKYNIGYNQAIDELTKWRDELLKELNHD